MFTEEGEVSIEAPNAADAKASTADESGGGSGTVMGEGMGDSNIDWGSDRVFESPKSGESASGPWPGLFRCSTDIPLNESLRGVLLGV